MLLFLVVVVVVVVVVVSFNAGFGDKFGVVCVVALCTLIDKCPRGVANDDYKNDNAHNDNDY